MNYNLEYWEKQLLTAPAPAPGYKWGIFFAEPCIYSENKMAVAWLTAYRNETCHYFKCVISEGPNSYLMVNVYDVEEGLTLLALWSFMGLLD